MATERDLIKDLIGATIKFNKRKDSKFQPTRGFIREELQTMEWILLYDDVQKYFNDMCIEFKVKDL